MVQRLPEIDVANDPADNFLLAMAHKASAEYIVTGDKAGLLALKQHGVTRLVGVTEMVAALKLR
jgi:predicted nucleic acid-binding protein